MKMRKKDFLTIFNTRIPKTAGSIIYLLNILMEFLILISLLSYILFFYFEVFFLILIISFFSFYLIFLITSRKAKKYGIKATKNIQKKNKYIKRLYRWVKRNFYLFRWTNILPNNK